MMLSLVIMKTENVLGPQSMLEGMVRPILTLMLASTIPLLQYILVS